MRNKIIFVGLIFLTNLCFSYITIFSPKIISAGENFLTVSEPTFFNPANLLDQQKTIYFMYSNPYFSYELNKTLVSFSLPTEIGNIAFTSSFYGIDVYKELYLFCSYGIGFDKFSFGGKIKFFVINVETDDETIVSKQNFVFGLDLSFGYSVTKNFYIFFMTTNVNSPEYKFTNYEVNKIKPEYIVGIRYDLYENVKLFMEKQYDTALSYGGEFLLTKNFCFRCGVNKYGKACFGFSIETKKLDIDFSVKIDPILGWDPSFAVGYKF